MRPFLILLSALPLFAGPLLYFPEKAFDFGNILQGDVVSHTFSFENRGDSVLTISKVSASCGCTAGEAGKKRLKPAEKSELKVTFNSEKFTGDQKKTVLVYTNDAQKPYEEILISARVKKILSVEPSYLSFMKDTTLELAITNHHSLSIRYIHAESSLPEIVFDRKFPLFSADIRPDSVFVFRVRAEIKGALEESRYGNIDVKINYEDGRSFTRRMGAVIKKWQ
jgi:hypothetical protein